MFKKGRQHLPTKQSAHKVFFFCAYVEFFLLNTRVGDSKKIYRPKQEHQPFLRSSVPNKYYFKLHNVS